MKVTVLGRHTDDLSGILDDLGIERVAAGDTPDLIITYGGDGALIGAEYDFPGIPKLGMRDARSCVKCDQHDDRAVLEQLKRGECSKTRLMRLRCRVMDKEIWGLNDVILRNGDLRSALRFEVFINGERASDEIIGDGLVASTPFGSSAYFRSITNTTFRSGIGLAFNNCTEFANHLVLNEEDSVTVKIVRGPAQLSADNNPTTTTLNSGEEIVLDKAHESSEILALDNLRCSLCRYKHAPRRRF